VGDTSHDVFVGISGVKDVALFGAFVVVGIAGGRFSFARTGGATFTE
jgi:hypothetical protein